MDAHGDSAIKNDPLKLALPSLYQSADLASGRGQSLYLRLVGGQLVALLIAGCVGVLNYRWAAILTAAIFAAAMLFWATLLTIRPERAWFDGRAIAESIKSLAWRFAMRVSPFDAESDETAAKRFREDYHGILNEREEMSAGLVSERNSAVVTPEMASIRALPLEERTMIYQDQRLEDQRRWYSHQARSNERWGQVSLVVIVFFQTFGFTAATFRAAGVIHFDAMSIFSAFGAAAVAWLALKRHHEQAQAYGIAALELTQIADVAAKVHSETDLAEVVVEGEGAISREHTLWRAKRNRQ